MRNTKYTNSIAWLLIVAFAMAPVYSANAELVEEVEEDVIVPENNLPVQKKIVYVKPAPKKVVKKVIIQPQVEEEDDLAFEQESAQVTSVAVNNTNINANENVATARPSAGNTIDKGIQDKMDGVRQQFEDALIKSLDRIKISVDDGSQAPAPMTTTEVTDSVVVNQAAPVAVENKETYISLENAPKVENYDDSEEADIVSVAQEEEAPKKSTVKVSPVIGWTTLNSDTYKVDSKYTLGVNFEVAIDENLAATLGYSYSEFSIGLGGTANPFYNYYYNNNNGFLNNNTTTLQYNQNVFDVGLRYYLFPSTSKFRMFVGGGFGYNKGYLNYQKQRFSNYMGVNPYRNVEDYEVTSYLGIVSTGAELQASKTVSFGAEFKYSNVLSSKENQPLINYGFIQNGYGNQYLNDQQIVGGSISEDSFYSILGTVKIAF
ncbi:MAG: porin family protein [Oligoflexia bacterium]|nr:porin family protein [Oligoflexia bacterium]